MPVGARRRQTSVVWRAVAAGSIALLLLVLPAQTRAGGTLDLGTFTLLRSGPRGGTIWRGVIPGATRKSALYLPPRLVSGRRYPVVYLLHGMPGSPWSYINSLSLATLGDNLIGRHEARPFIAVVPVAGPSGHYDGEWAGEWEQYLVQRVVPWVDGHLPIARAAGDRTIAGLSAGGYGAVDIGLRHPRLFGRLESWGGYFEPFRDGSLADADSGTLAAHDPTSLVVRKAPLLRRLGTRFYLSTGPGHGQIQPRLTRAFAHELARLHLPYRLALLRDGRHQWERQLAAGLRWAVAPSSGPDRGVP
jgi:putative tributyrin esterase